MTMQTTLVPPIWRFSIFVLLAACVACSKKGEDSYTTTPSDNPDRLSINVTVKDDQTVSRFVVRERGAVAFYNKGERELTLLFNNEKGEQESPFCKGDGKAEDNPIRIDAGDEKMLTICRGMAGKWFKYTAQIGDAAEEDPIIWVE
ncbi:MAG TPA: hypothetical protein VML92_08015 [Steroidobacteraceae bacterium]|nr:hypothetical protein [Steroidobacteraceae bacterium]